MQRRSPSGDRRGSSPRRWGSRLFLWALPLLAGVVPIAAAQSEQLDEYDVKSAYLFNIARFVEWPESALALGDSSFVICVVGNDPFGPKLDARFHDRTIHGLKIRVERRQHADELPFCHLVFIALPSGEEVQRLLHHLEGDPVLTVGDRLPLARTGGIMNFYLEDDAVRFEMNPAAIDRSRLRVSSKLLNLARIVEAG